MVLELTGVHLGFGVVGGILVEVGEEDGLRVGGFDMFSRTAVAVSAGANFVVEGAVDLWFMGLVSASRCCGLVTYLILFCSEYAGKILRHLCD